MSNTRGSDLVQHVLDEFDEDPRADCNRLRDPQAHDTNPYGPKANYVAEPKLKLPKQAKVEPSQD